MGYNDKYSLTEDLYRQRFKVQFEYPVYFTHDIFAAANNTLSRTFKQRHDDGAQKILIYLDRGLAEARPGIIEAVKAAFDRLSDSLQMAEPPQLVPGGEAVKDGWETVHQVLGDIGKNGLDRHSRVVGVGGGAMLDALGLATSLAHRGLGLVRIPTTTLGQCDAGVGVKNGINDYGIKNFAGTFAPPSAVIIDFEFLSTLSQPDWIGGIAEAFKVAMIKDAEFFDFLCSKARAAAARDPAIMERIIRRCAIIHLDHIREQGDPFETGSARPLDFGHWSAHHLEWMSRYRISHGQAVAMGLAIDSHYAMQIGLLAPAVFTRLIKGLFEAELPIWHPCLEKRDDNGDLLILAGLQRFREHLGGPLTITLPDGIGAKLEVHTIDTKRLENAIEALRNNRQ